jgi:AcrR family transcriptional regulator
MPRPRFLKLPEAKRNAIIEAAKAEFAASGFEGASYNRIIAAAGLSKGAMYYYFDDKLDLYVTVLEDVNERMNEAMGFDESWQPDGAFWDVMRDMSIRAWSFAIEHPELAALMKGLSQLPHSWRKEGRVGDLFSSWRRLMVTLLRAGQAQGQVRDDRPLELLVEVAFALDEAIDMWLIDHTGELADDPVEEVVDMALDFWRRLLRPATSAPRER